MTASPNPRGRPRSDTTPLSRGRILSCAEQLLAEGASDVSMRAVASALGVNAMALYHYFSDKQALKAALVEQAFAPLLAVGPKLRKLPSPERRLRLLADTYLRCAARALPLTRHLAVKGGAPLAAEFSALLDDAWGAPMSRLPGAAAARDVLVDYLHGVALAGPKNATKALEAGWPCLLGGIRSYLAQPS